MPLRCIKCKKSVTDPDFYVTENATRENYVYRELTLDADGQITDRAPWENTLNYEEPFPEFYRCENCEAESHSLDALLENTE